MAHTAKLGNTETVIEIEGTKFVLLGRLCRAAGIPYNHGLDVAQRHAAKVGREKKTVDLGSTKTKCVVLPLARLHKWLALLHPHTVSGILIANQLSRYQAEAAKQARAPYPEFIMNALGQSECLAPRLSSVDNNVAPIKPMMAPAKFCDAVASEDQKQPSELVRLASQIDKAENRLRIAKKAAAASKKQLDSLKQEMAKKLGLSAEPQSSTVADYCLLRNIPIDSAKASAIGNAAKAYCLRSGLEIGKTPHPHWGSVNVYPVSAIDHAMSQKGGDA